MEVTTTKTHKDVFALAVTLGLGPGAMLHVFAEGYWHLWLCELSLELPCLQLVLEIGYHYICTLQCTCNVLRSVWYYGFCPNFIGLRPWQKLHDEWRRWKGKAHSKIWLNMSVHPDILCSRWLLKMFLYHRRNSMIICRCTFNEEKKHTANMVGYATLVENKQVYWQFIRISLRLPSWTRSSSINALRNVIPLFPPRKPSAIYPSPFLWQVSLVFQLAPFESLQWLE